MQTQPCGHFSQPIAAGCEDPAQLSAVLSFSSRACQRSALLPRRGEDSLGRDHGLAFSEEPAGKVDQGKITAERESFEHPSTL